MVIAKIALRNLLRQKRRNILLGMGIAIGMCMLILINSFAAGITDLLLNKVIVNMAGHIIIQSTERNKQSLDIIRDKDKLASFLKENLKGEIEIKEAVSIPFVRALGNGKAGNLTIIGFKPENYDPTFGSFEKGSIEEFKSSTHENPIIIFKQIADDLNVDLFDVIRCRFKTVHGQDQTAHFTVTGILKAENMFMNMLALVHENEIKSLLQMRMNEVNSVSVVFKKLTDPASVIMQADRIHKLLTPEIAGISVKAGTSAKSIDAKLFAFLAEEENILKLKEKISLKSGGLTAIAADDNAVVISEKSASELGLKMEDNITFRYKPKFDSDEINIDAVIGGIFASSSGLPDNMMLANPDIFYRYYYQYRPAENARVEESNPLRDFLLKEYTLMERSRTSMELRDKYLDLQKKKWKGAMLDVETMYEAASFIIDIQNALGVVSLIAGIIIFAIILIGVGNTLRMTIRERTREIGTVRAIGMQKETVLLSFVYEVVFLTVIACIAGIILSFIIMAGLYFVKIDLKDNPLSILFLYKRIHFVTMPFMVFLSLVFITIITGVFAIIPAKRAAKIDPVKALGHFE